MVQCIKMLINLSPQNDTSVQKIARLEKQIEQEKRLNGNLAAEIRKLNEEALRLENSSYSNRRDQDEQVIKPKCFLYVSRCTMPMKIY